MRTFVRIISCSRTTDSTHDPGPTTTTSAVTTATRHPLQQTADAGFSALQPLGFHGSRDVPQRRVRRHGLHLEASAGRTCRAMSCDVAVRDAGSPTSLQRYRIRHHVIWSSVEWCCHLTLRRGVLRFATSCRDMLHTSVGWIPLGEVRIRNRVTLDSQLCVFLALPFCLTNICHAKNICVKCPGELPVRWGMSPLGSKSLNPSLSMRDLIPVRQTAFGGFGRMQRGHALYDSQSQNSGARSRNPKFIQ